MRKELDTFMSAIYPCLPRGNTNIMTMEKQKANQKSIKNRYNPKQSFTENNKAIVENIYSWCKATILRTVTSAIEHAVLYDIIYNDNKG